LIELGSHVQNYPSYGYFVFQYVLLSALAGSDDDGAVAVRGAAVVGSGPFAELVADVAALAYRPSALQRHAKLQDYSLRVAAEGD
jgi:hypothetical protein